MFVEIVLILAVHVSSGDADRHNGISVAAADLEVVGNTTTLLIKHKDEKILRIT